MIYIRVPELNILAICFACAIPNRQTLAILHLDYRNKVQLIAHDLHTMDMDLSRSASTLLPNTAVSSNHLPLVETPPIMIHVPSSKSKSLGNEDSPGGVLIVGGRTILYYELSSREWQEAQTGKQSRLDQKKKSGNDTEVAAALKKQKEREGKKRKPRSCVDWPWSEVSA